MKNDPERVRMSGPLAVYSEGFAVALAERGYRPSMVARHLRLMAYVSRWLQTEGLAASTLDARTVDAIRAERRATGHPAGLAISSPRPMLEYLRAVGVLPPAGPSTTPSPADDLLTRYAEYLVRERGLAKETIARNLHAARAFLADRQLGTQLQLEALTVNDVIAFVLGLSRRQPRSLPRTATVLRSLLSFLHLKGVVGAELAGSVPRAASHRLTGLPMALTGEQVAALLACCDRASVVGRRDLAILTVLSRLGLRAGEVARLRLDDIDWRRGVVTVVGKGNRHEQLPLPADVGAAVVAYLSDGRPDTTARELFLRVTAPHRAMSPRAVSTLVATAARRAGLGTVHAHRLRHSAATAMLHNGASLAEIGQVLRHVDPKTTAIYAKVDIEGLRAVAGPWPVPLVAEVDR